MFWSLVAAFKLLHQVQNVHFRYALLRHRDSSHEAIERHELLLEVNRLVVPPHEFGRDFVCVEDGNGSTVADRRRALNCTSAVLLDCRIDPGQAVVVEASEVELANISRVVYVTNENVDVLGGAKA